MKHSLFLQLERAHFLIKNLIILLISLFITACEVEKNNRLFTFTYTVNLEPSNGEKVELWIPIPQSNEVQNISNLNISSGEMIYEIKSEKKHNNKYAYIYTNDGLSKSNTIEMTFDVLRFEHQNKNYIDVNSDFYLKASSMVPTGKIFNHIIKDNGLQKSNMRNVYDFVLSGMHYGKPKSRENQYYNDPWLTNEGKYGMKEVSRDEVVELYNKAKKTNSTYTFGNGNSIYACDIGVGNCTDYHSYFISLSRTLGVPARFHMGFPIPLDKEGEIGGYHCWADYYVDKEGWYPVDISEADKNSKKIDYFFGNICFNRVEMTVGRDFELDGYEKEIANFFVYPILEVADKESNSYTKNFSYKDK